MRIQVVVKHGDRVWDSIRATEASALFQIGSYLGKDNEEPIKEIGTSLKYKLVFGVSVPIVKEWLEDNGFTITIKDLSQGE